jgi:hypothetical protein
VTDQIELPVVPQSPPIITLTGANEDAASVFLFDRDRFNEMLVPLRIRDEDLIETLKMRWRIESEVPRPPGGKEYTCPEPEIVGDGNLIRSAQLKLQGSSFARGTCNRVDVIVSSSFKTCKPEPDADDGWDITTMQDDDADIGRLSFWVWAYDATGNPVVQPAAALNVTMSCQSLDYAPPTGTASSTIPATGL